MINKYYVQVVLWALSSCGDVCMGAVLCGSLLAGTSMVISYGQYLSFNMDVGHIIIMLRDWAEHVCFDAWKGRLCAGRRWQHSWSAPAQAAVCRISTLSYW